MGYHGRMSQSESHAENAQDVLLVDNTDDVAVLASRTSDLDAGARSRSLAILPILLGVSALIVNIVILTGGVGGTVFRQLSFWLAGNISAVMILTSIFLGIFLVVYGLVLRNYADSRGTTSHWFVAWIIVPLLLGLAAPLATIWGLSNWDRSQDPKQPCIELYQQAQSIHKDNPKFRMPQDSADQVRCRINEVVIG